MLAAGQKLKITSLDTEDVVFEVQAPDNEVLNIGELITHGGAAAIFAGSIKHSGSINADSVSIDRLGRVVLSAKQDITVDASATISANGPTGGTIAIESESGDTLFSGTIEANGSDGKGGSIHILGDRVGLFEAAIIEASGDTGGGEVLVGGSYQGRDQNIKNAQATYVAEDVVIEANAIASGDGGKVIVWADETNQVFVHISATGGTGSGNGGFVETSAHYLEVINAPDITVANGESGTWLLDPSDITVSFTPDSRITPGTPFQPDLTSGAGTSFLSATTLVAALNGGGTIILDTTESVGTGPGPTG